MATTNPQVPSINVTGSRAAMSATVTTTGGVVATPSLTQDIASVAFTTDGTNGQLTYTFTEPLSSANFVATHSGVLGTGVPVFVTNLTRAVGSLIVEVNDVTGAPIDLSAIDVTLDSFLGQQS